MVADGLPDMSELWPRTPAPVAAAEPAGGPFDDDLPEEAPVELRLELPPVSWLWSATAVAEAVPIGVGAGAPPEDDYWKGQLALAVDESAVLQQDQQASPRARAQTLLWAARAAERAGRGDALRLYEQVLAVGPGLPEAAAAVRGQFRLLYTAGAASEAREKLAALVEADPVEAGAYRTLLAREHARGCGRRAGRARAAHRRPADEPGRRVVFGRGADACGAAAELVAPHGGDRGALARGARTHHRVLRE
jgi:hypothetical protein